MKKPIYTSADVSNQVSIVMAEREIDDHRDNYKRQINWWWDTLTIDQKTHEWDTDPDLKFYVTNPYNIEIVNDSKQFFE